MSSSKILEKALPSEIQAAMGVALLHLKNGRTMSGHKLTLEDIGHVMGCTGSAVSLYVTNPTKMAAVSWIKATARWPELNDMLLAELDEAEKAAAARQRTFKLEQAA